MIGHRIRAQHKITNIQIGYQAPYFTNIGSTLGLSFSKKNETESQ